MLLHRKTYFEQAGHLLRATYSLSALAPGDPVARQTELFANVFMETMVSHYLDSGAIRSKITLLTKHPAIWPQNVPGCEYSIITRQNRLCQHFAKTNMYFPAPFNLASVPPNHIHKYIWVFFHPRPVLLASKSKNERQTTSPGSFQEKGDEKEESESYSVCGEV